MTHDTRGISVMSQIIQASAYCFYIIHGTIIEDPPIVILGLSSMVQSAVLIGQYFLYKYELFGFQSYETLIGKGKVAPTEDIEAGSNEIIELKATTS